LREAAHELASLVAEVADRLELRGKEFVLVTMGGTIGRSRFFDAEIDDALKRVVSTARMDKLRISPAEAAALAARGSDAG
jgi:hypothetical protein